MELQLTPMVTTPTRGRRKRQLAFADGETQIPKKKIRECMAASLNTCEPLVSNLSGTAARLRMFTDPEK